MLKFTDASKKAAAACRVRECDQEQPGRYVAYVDEGADSYDVFLELNAAGEPERGGCDCPLRKPCRHQAALYLFVAEGQAPVSPDVAPAAKKGKAAARTSPAGELLATLAGAELSGWLLELFAANKDIELAFLNRFGAARELTAADVAGLSQAAVRTVLGRKRIPDGTQITRLLQLWRDLHKPVAERYAAAPASRDAFEALLAAADTVMEFAAAHPGTAKLQKYAKDLLGGFAVQVSLLRQDEAFYTAVGFPVMHLLRQPYESRIVCIDYLRELAKLLSGARLSWLAETIGTQYLLHHEQRALNGDLRYQMMVLGVIRKAGVFAGYAGTFRTRSWNPEFNLPLLDAWTDAGMYEIAETAAWSEIGRNTKESHNAPYYEALERIYTASGNAAGLVRLLKQLVPHTFSFDDYLRVIESTAEISARRAFRDRIYTAARNAKTPAAREFVLLLNVHEGNWERIQDMIRTEDLGYDAALRYFKGLSGHDADGLIRALMQRRDWNAAYAKDQAEVRETVAALVERIRESYSEQPLRKLVTRLSIGYQYSTSANLFRQAMLASLGAAPDARSGQ